MLGRKWPGLCALKSVAALASQLRETAEGGLTPQAGVDMHARGRQDGTVSCDPTVSSDLSLSGGARSHDMKDHSADDTSLSGSFLEADVDSCVGSEVALQEDRAYRAAKSRRRRRHKMPVSAAELERFAKDEGLDAVEGPCGIRLRSREEAWSRRAPPRVDTTAWATRPSPGPPMEARKVSL